MTVQCGVVQPWISGWSWIKFTDLPDPVKRPHLSYRRCGKEATATISHDGFVFRWCDEHVLSPICGVPAPFGTDYGTEAEIAAKGKRPHSREQCICCPACDEWETREEANRDLDIMFGRRVSER